MSPVRLAWQAINMAAAPLLKWMQCHVAARHDKTGSLWIKSNYSVQFWLDHMNRVPFIFGGVHVALAAVVFAAPFQISGPYANRLSQIDIEQITALVSKDPHVDHRLKKVEAIRPDKVHVQTGGRTAVDENTYNRFNANKRAGRWSIDEASIEIIIEKIVLPNNGPILIR